MGYPWWVGVLVSLPLYAGVAALILWAYRIEKAERSELVRRIRERGAITYVFGTEEWMDGEPGEGVCLGGYLPPRGDEVELPA